MLSGHPGNYTTLTDVTEDGGHMELQAIRYAADLPPKNWAIQKESLFS